MADIRTTIKKTVMGNKRVHFGTATYVNGQTSSTIDTQMTRGLESFSISQMQAYTNSSGTITITHADPGASAGVVGWIAIGQ